MRGLFEPWHLIVLAIIIIALFGYNKLPDITRSVGRSLRIFKTEMKGLSEDDRVREQAKEHGEVAVAPSVTPVTMEKEAPAVAGAPPVGSEVGPTGTTQPTPDDVARAQAVLDAAAAAGADRAVATAGASRGGAPVSPPVPASGAATVPPTSHAGSAAH